MMHRTRAAPSLFALAVALIAGLAAPAGGARAAEKARVVTIEIRARAVADDSRTVQVRLGDAVTLRWSTDEATELHLHGYDIALTLLPGRPAEMRFTAHAAGRFPISAHGFGVPAPGVRPKETVLLYLEVYPR